MSLPPLAAYSGRRSICGYILSLLSAFHVGGRGAGPGQYPAIDESVFLSNRTA